MRERNIIRDAAREQGYLQDHKDNRKEALPLVRDRKTTKSIANLIRNLELAQARHNEKDTAIG